MFFSVELLCRRSNGRFSIIWLAATRGIQHVSQRDVISVDVAATCEQILEYVVCRSSSTTKRLSLYLSAQLMYGTVLVHRQQLSLFQNTIASFFLTIRRPIPNRESRFLDDADVEGKRGGRPKKRPAKKRQPGVSPAAEQPPLHQQQVDERELARLFREMPFSTTANPDQITLREEISLQVRRDEYDPFLSDYNLDAPSAALLATTSAQAPALSLNETVEPVGRKRRLTGSLQGRDLSKRARIRDITESAVLEPNVIVVERGQLSPDPPLAQQLLESAVVSGPGDMVQEVPVPQEVPAPPEVQVAEEVQGATVAHPPAADGPRGRRRGRRPARAVTYSDLVQAIRSRPSRINRPTLLENDLLRLPPVRISADVESFTFDDMKEIVNQILLSRSRRLRDEVEANAVTDSAVGGLTAAQVEPRAECTEPDPTPLRTLTPQRTRIEAGPVTEHPATDDLADFSAIQQPRETAIPDIEPRTPRVHTSTPIPFATESRRQTDLLILLRSIFRENGGAPVKLAEICFPLNRYKVATTFHDLLILKTKQYVELESLPNSVEMNYIRPGPRL